MSITRSGNEVVISGTKDIMRILEEIAPKEAGNLMRATVNGIAAEARKEIRKRAPKDTGFLRKAIKSRRKKSPPYAPLAIVYADKGAGYWKPLEYGSKINNLKAYYFMRDGAAVVQKNLEEITTRVFTKRLEAKIKRDLKKQAALP